MNLQSGLERSQPQPCTFMIFCIYFCGADICLKTANNLIYYLNKISVVLLRTSPDYIYIIGAVKLQNCHYSAKKKTHLVIRSNLFFFPLSASIDLTQNGITLAKHPDSKAVSNSPSNILTNIPFLFSEVISSLLHH